MKLKLIKAGMTSIFTENGAVESCTILQLPKTLVVKSVNNNNKRKTLLFMEHKKHMTKPISSMLEKNNITTKGIIYEVFEENLTTGSQMNVDVFNSVKYIDVQGTSKGKGFAGMIKRHGAKGGRASHGNSVSHRTVGSIGCRQDPGKVMKGKKLPGHVGNAIRTQKKLKILDINLEQNIIVVKGSVPGNNNSVVTINISRGVKNNG